MDVDGIGGVSAPKGNTGSEHDNTAIVHQQAIAS